MAKETLTPVFTAEALRTQRKRRENPPAFNAKAQRRKSAEAQGGVPCASASLRLCVSPDFGLRIYSTAPRRAAYVCLVAVRVRSVRAIRVWLAFGRRVAVVELHLDVANMRIRSDNGIKDGAPSEEMHLATGAKILRRNGFLPGENTV